VSPATPAAGTDPIALLAALPLEDGQLWGARAQAFQWADVRAFLDRSPGAPRRHFIARGRGMSKTSDLAALIVTLLLTEAPARSRSFVYAADADQASIMLDRISGFVERANLGGLIEVGASTVTHRRTGATVSIEASDGASAFGKLAWLQVVDEFSVWASTDNYRRLWSAITSAVTKVEGARLIVISMGGSPGSLAGRWWSKAERSRHWRTAREPGPSPWAHPDDVEAEREALTDSEYRRLILAEWAEGDDSLTRPEDFEACVRAGNPELPPNGVNEYIAALDVGTRRDLTAFAVGHAENRESGRVIVIDRVIHWRPGKGAEGRVDLTEVEATVLRVCREYNVARLRNDRMQAEQMVGNLARAGLRVQEFVFSSSGAAKLARGLHVAIRDHALSLPDDPELRAEAQTVRMVETGPGLVKLSNPAGTHDDVLTAIGMVVADFTERAEGSDFATFSIPGEVAARMGRTLTNGGRGAYPGLPAARSGLPLAYRLPFRGPLAEARRGAAQQTEAMRRSGFTAIVVEGTANSPDRVTREPRG
jgi:hypothetical protein